MQANSRGGARSRADGSTVPACWISREVKRLAVHLWQRSWRWKDVWVAFCSALEIKQMRCRTLRRCAPDERGTVHVNMGCTCGREGAPPPFPRCGLKRTAACHRHVFLQRRQSQEDVSPQRGRRGRRAFRKQSPGEGQSKHTSRETARGRRTERNERDPTRTRYWQNTQRDGGDVYVWTWRRCWCY